MQMPPGTYRIMSVTHCITISPSGVLKGLWPAIAKGRHRHSAIVIARGHHS